MLGYITEQLRVQTLTFRSTLGQGRGEEGKEEVKRATFPTLLTMIVVTYSYRPKKFFCELINSSWPIWTSPVYLTRLLNLCFPLQNAAATVMVQGMAASAVTRNPDSVHVRTIYTNEHVLSAKMVSSHFQQWLIPIVSSVIATMVEA